MTFWSRQRFNRRIKARGAYIPDALSPLLAQSGHPSPLDTAACGTRAGRTIADRDNAGRVRPSRGASRWRLRGVPALAELQNVPNHWLGWNLHLQGGMPPLRHDVCGGSERVYDATGSGAGARPRYPVIRGFPRVAGWSHAPTNHYMRALGRCSAQFGRGRSRHRLPQHNRRRPPMGVATG
jgi:hypothetical protein